MVFHFFYSYLPFQSFLCVANSQSHSDFFFILTATFIAFIIQVQVAQKLYEGIKLSDEEATGLITYMRTDGLHVSISFAL